MSVGLRIESAYVMYFISKMAGNVVIRVIVECHFIMALHSVLIGTVSCFSSTNQVEYCRKGLLLNRV